MRRLRSALLAATMFAAAAPLAHADATPEQAQQLEQQLRTWMAGLLGPNVPMADRPIHVSPEGDHFRFSIDIAGPAGPGTITAAPITAAASPLDGGRWNVTDLQIPSPLRYSNPTATGKQIRDWGAKIAEQTETGIFDPSFATATTLDGTLRDYTQVTDTPDGSTTVHIGRYATHSVWQPTGDGRIDMRSDGHGEALESTSPTPSGQTVTLSADRLTSSGEARRVSVDKVGAVARAAFLLVPTISAAGEAAQKNGAAAPPKLSPADRAAAHALTDAAADSLAGLDTSTSFDGVRFSAGGHTGTLQRVALGLGLAAPSGKLAMHMRMTFDGLDTPEIPPGIFHDYLPHHVSLAPYVSGVPSADLIALVNRAIDSDGSSGAKLELDAMGRALLTKGPVSVGFDDVAFDAGPAALTGSGAVLIASASPDDVTGSAVIRITGYDALMQQVGAVPLLQSGVAVMIFLKGIGKPVGDAIEWDISYAKKKMLVNGTDLSALIPKK